MSAFHPPVPGHRHHRFKGPLILPRQPHSTLSQIAVPREIVLSLWPNKPACPHGWMVRPHFLPSLRTDFAPLCKLYSSLIDGFETSEEGGGSFLFFLAQICVTILLSASLPFRCVLHIHWMMFFMIMMVCRWRRASNPVAISILCAMLCCWGNFGFITPSVCLFRKTT